MVGRNKIVDPFFQFLRPKKKRKKKFIRSSSFPLPNSLEFTLFCLYIYLFVNVLE